LVIDVLFESISELKYSHPIRRQSQDLTLIQTDWHGSMNQFAAFNQRFIFPLPFAMEIIKIHLWNQGTIMFE
jgi:hypothetical protein